MEATVRLRDARGRFLSRASMPAKKRAAKPRKQDPTDKLWREFKKNNGVLSLSIEGDGTYTFVRGMSFKGFPLITYWKGRGRSANTVCAAYGDPKLGGQVLFSPWGYRWGKAHGNKWTEKQMFYSMVPVVQSNRLSRISCGNHIGVVKSHPGRRL